MINRVEEDHSFLDLHYVYYVYHGPLVRGLKSADVGLPNGERMRKAE